jgi:hypothetical protein
MLSFKKEISIGELLTFISITASLISVIANWTIDRRIRMQENASNVRMAIAKTMDQINQVKDLQLQYYELIEEDIEDVGYMMVIKKEKNVIARDFLWKKMFIRRAEQHTKIMGEEWKIGYINLLPYNIKIDSLYQHTATRLSGLESVEFALMLNDLEDIILDFNEKTDFHTDLLTGPLRANAKFHLENHVQHVEEAVAPLNRYLTSLFNASDEELLFGKLQKPTVIQGKLVID